MLIAFPNNSGDSNNAKTFAKPFSNKMYRRALQLIQLFFAVGILLSIGSLGFLDVEYFYITVVLRMKNRKQRIY